MLDMAEVVGTKSSSQFVFFLLLFAVNSHDLAVCQGTCRPHDIREVSECTPGFTSVFHIEVVEDPDQTELHSHDSRQVLIPDMNFNCTGRITKWIFLAKWEGNSQAFTELQVWRRSDNVGNVYSKVAATTIRVDVQSSNQLYEYPVDPPLAFQERDIIGYFQPDDDISQLDIYLESSDRIVTIRDNIEESQRLPPSGTFDLDAAGHITGQEYPLIGTETDQPNCGCGLVTIERMNALLTVNTGNIGRKTVFPQHQAIFPNARFTCSGQVVKWIMGATYLNVRDRVNFPELQIWRPTGSTTYQKLNGTSIEAKVEEDSGIYEFIVDPPLPFQPGDILGVFQPSLEESRLLVDYNALGVSVNYRLSLNSNQVEPAHTFIDINVGGWQMGQALPLVSVEIAQDIMPEVTTTSSSPTLAVSAISSGPTLAVTVTAISSSPTLAVTTTSSSPTLTVTAISSSPTLAVTVTAISSSPTQAVTTTSSSPTLTVTAISSSPTQAVTATSSSPTLTVTAISSSPTLTVTAISSSPATRHTPATPTMQMSSASTVVMPSAIYVSQMSQDITERVATNNVINILSTQIFTNTQSIPVLISSLSSSPISSMPAVASANTSSIQGLMFYVGLGVVGMLAVLICALIMVIIAILRCPRKREIKQNQVNNTPDPSNAQYELYTNPARESSSPEHTEPPFDNPIYNTPTVSAPSDFRCKLMDISKLYTQESNGNSSHTITAYAISNVHCTPNRANRQPSYAHDYDEPLQ